MDTGISLYISDSMLCLTVFFIVVALFRLWIKDERLMILRDIDLSPVLLLSLFTICTLFLNLHCCTLS